MVKRLAVFGAAGLWVCAAVFGGGGKEAETTPLQAALLLSGAANDQGWNAVAVQGLREAEREFGIRTSYQENVGVADIDAAYTGFAAEGYDLVIGHGNEFGDPALRVAAKFPRVRFVAIEGSVQAPNVSSYVIACEEAGYLMGLLAASMSKTGKLGIVGAVEQPSITKVLEAYKLGARSVRPDIVVYEAYVNSYTDVAAGKEAALAMADKGADVLSHCANQAGAGAIKAAEERGLLATGDSYDQSAISPGTVMCSTVYSVPTVVLAAVDKVRNGTFTGGIYNLGMRDGAVDIAPYHDFENRIPEEVKALVAETKERIRSGEFTVPLIEKRTYQEH